MKISRVIIFLILVSVIAGSGLQTGCLGTQMSGSSNPPFSENTGAGTGISTAGSEATDQVNTDTGSQTAAAPPVVYSSPGSVVCDANSIWIKNISLSNSMGMFPSGLCMDVKVLNEASGEYENLSLHSLQASSAVRDPMSQELEVLASCINPSIDSSNLAHPEHPGLIPPPAKGGSSDSKNPSLPSLPGFKPLQANLIITPVIPQWDQMDPEAKNNACRVYNLESAQKKFAVYAAYRPPEKSSGESIFSGSREGLVFVGHHITLDPFILSPPRN